MPKELTTERKVNLSEEEFEAIAKHIMETAFGADAVQYTTRLRDVLPELLAALSTFPVKNRAKTGCDKAAKKLGIKLNRGHAAVIVFEAAMVMLLSALPESSTLKITIEKFLETFPGCTDLSEEEKAKILDFRNTMNVAMEIIPHHHNRAHLMDITTRIAEGWNVRYTLGGGQSSGTTRRLAIFEQLVSARSRPTDISTYMDTIRKMTEVISPNIPNYSSSADVEDSSRSLESPAGSAPAEAVVPAVTYANAEAAAMEAAMDLFPEACEENTIQITYPHNKNPLVVVNETQVHTDTGILKLSNYYVRNNSGDSEGSISAIGESLSKSVSSSLSKSGSFGGSISIVSPSIIVGTGSSFIEKVGSGEAIGGLQSVDGEYLESLTLLATGVSIAKMTETGDDIDDWINAFSFDHDDSKPGEYVSFHSTKVPNGVVRSVSIALEVTSLPGHLIQQNSTTSQILGNTSAGEGGSSFSGQNLFDEIDLVNDIMASGSTLCRNLSKAHSIVVPLSSSTKLSSSPAVCSSKKRERENEGNDGENEKKDCSD